MNEVLAHALEVVADEGGRLVSAGRFDWPAVAQQTVHRLRLFAVDGQLPPVVGIAGGASSGKSTVFNNLLDRHLASRITARGHATLGPILAAHEQHRPRIERLLAEGRLLPGFAAVFIDLDGNVAGRPDVVSTLFHTIEGLREVLLLDLPDFTSERAHQEGDITLSLLPWFDRLVIVVDHERWFDRQSISTLRTESTRFGHRRWVLFNRTCEGALRDEDRSALSQQAHRLAADGMTVLEFRRGRGFCLFPPETLDDVRAFVAEPSPNRRPGLLIGAGRAAGRVLNQNEERAARLDELRESLEATVLGMLPTPRDCMMSLMMPAERKRVDLMTRVLRLGETKDWIAAQTQRIRDAFGRVPIVGALVRGPVVPSASQPVDPSDRRQIATNYSEAVARRHTCEIQTLVRGARFWDEVRRWTGDESAPRQIDSTHLDAPYSATDSIHVREAATTFDVALGKWLSKVETECEGISPALKGAVGLGTLGLAIVLIAAPGPVAVLTLVTAKGAVGAALGQLMTAAGAGALLGKPMGRLMAIVREKLLSSPEFEAVQQATSSFRALLESACRRRAAEALSEASALVMSSDDPLISALQCLRDAGEEES